jgi:hypothetical protein
LSNDIEFYNQDKRVPQLTRQRKQTPSNKDANLNGMALDILPDHNIPLFSSEAAHLRSPEIFSSQLAREEHNLVIQGLPLATKEMKTQSAVEELLLTEEDATPLLQRRAASQQTTSASTLPRAGAISRKLPLPLHLIL